MYTKSDLKKQLKEMGINNEGTVLVHSSFKSMGDVEGGPDTVLDSLSEYMEDGLLVLPTHTWKYILEDNPNFYVQDSPSNVGALTEMFRKRENVIRSYHPTHSVAALGKDAKSFTEGEEQVDTPCARDSVYGKLLDREAQILLVGVDLRRNTFSHGMEEWMDWPGRLTEEHEQLYTIVSDGTTLDVPQRRHKGLSWSEHFWKVDEVLQETGAMHLGQLGDATVRVCDTVKMTEVLTKMLEADIHLFSKNAPLNEEMRYFFYD